MAGSTRNPRLVAVHRGGSLADSDHRLLAVWAAGQCSVAQARDASVAAHAAARQSQGPARLPARACGHAAATAHMADHELGAAFYALQPLALAPPDVRDAERTWQLLSLPPPVSDLVRSDMRLRAGKFRGVFEGAHRRLARVQEPLWPHGRCVDIPFTGISQDSHSNPHGFRATLAT